VTQLRHNELAIALPPGWAEVTDVIAVLALERPEHAFQASVVITRDRADDGETAQGFAARQAPLLRAALPNYTLLTEAPLRVGEIDGFAREHTFRDAVPVRQLQWYAVNSGTAYTFTFTDQPATFEQTRPRALELLRNATFEADPGAR
jgi:hypothetical protein